MKREYFKLFVVSGVDIPDKFNRLHYKTFFAVLILNQISFIADFTIKLYLISKMVSMKTLLMICGFFCIDCLDIPDKFNWFCYENFFR